MRELPTHTNMVPLELWLIVLTGFGHVTVELLWGGAKDGVALAGQPEQLYNLSAIILWGAYTVWRGIRTPGLFHAWGFRRDNLLPAFRCCLVLIGGAAAALALYGGLTSRWLLPRTFWIVLPLYPFYGIAQQFALQALITRNLRMLIPHRILRIVVVGVLFGAAHFPIQPLMILTFAAGLGFTWIYEEQPNLWVVGIAHGLLGALAYYLVLGLDPGAEMIAGFREMIARVGFNQ